MATSVPPKTVDLLKIKSSEKSSDFELLQSGRIWMRLELSLRSFVGLEAPHVASTGNRVVGDLYNSVQSR